MSIPSLSSHLIASARCYRHDYLVMDRRSTATLICDWAARSCFHTQASLSRSVIGSASSPGGGSQAVSLPNRRDAVSMADDASIAYRTSRSGNRSRVAVLSSRRETVSIRKSGGGALGDGVSAAGHVVRGA